MKRTKKEVVAYVLDGKGGAEKIEPNDVKKELKKGKAVWVHLNLAYFNSENRNQEFPYINKWVFDNLICSDIHGSKIRIYQNRLLLILKTLRSSSGMLSDDFDVLRIYLKGNLIITASMKSGVDFSETNRRFNSQNGPKEAIEVLLYILESILDNIVHSIDSVEDMVNDVEEKIVIGKVQDSHYPLLSKLLRHVIVIRRFIIPEREIVDILVRQGGQFLSPEMERRFRDNFDRNRRIIEEVDLTEKRIRLNQDFLSHLEDRKTQRNTYMLSIVSGVFLPLSYVASVFGMNLSGIPLSEYQFGFLLVNIIMVIIGIFIWFLFKRLKWV